MSDRFWLGHLPTLDNAWTALLRPIVQVEPPFGLVLEAVQAGDDPAALTLLVSVVGADPTCGRCELGSSNRVDRVDDLRARGVIAIEAALFYDEERAVLRVELPPGLRVDGDDAAPEATNVVGTSALEIEGVRFHAEQHREASGWSGSFLQQRWSPQVGLETTALRTRSIEWIVDHRDVRESAGPCSVRFDGRPPRVPIPPVMPDVAAQWCGSVDLVRARSSRSPKVDSSRAWPWRAARYEYDDVDLLGFRIDLRGWGRRADEALEDLVEPLNFHRGAHRANLAFEYRPAARALVVEFLRYPRMRTVMAAPDDGAATLAALGLPELVASQYEMLVRVLVGRVDDGSTSAREPAVHVPLIYVDNPWSRLVGRESQGIEKRLASFVDRDGRCLQPAAARGAPSDLGLLDLHEVRASNDVASAAHGAGTMIVSIDIPNVEQVRQTWAGLAQRLDAAGALLLGGARWRQRDFAGSAFRRGFAREVLRDDPRRYRLLQRTPIDARPLPGAWIESEFALGDAAVDFPTGVATLEFGALPRSKALDALADLLGSDPIGLPTGDWYVGRFSMKQTVQSSLDDA